jgi:hypothetical protein
MLATSSPSRRPASLMLAVEEQDSASLVLGIFGALTAATEPDWAARFMAFFVTKHIVDLSLDDHPHYRKILHSIMETGRVEAERITVIGDIFEFDLLMPLQLGMHAVLLGEHTQGTSESSLLRIPGDDWGHRCRRRPRSSETGYGRL